MCVYVCVCVYVCERIRNESGMNAYRNTIDRNVRGRNAKGRNAKLAGMQGAETHEKGRDASGRIAMNRNVRKGRQCMLQESKRQECQECK
jgi:hypothetical protein